MYQFIYDGSMAGFLTAIFDAFERKARQDAVIVRYDSGCRDVFAQPVAVGTDAIKARRVWKGLSQKLSPEALDQLYYCHLSELEQTEGQLLTYIRYVFEQPERKVEVDFGHPAVLWVAQTARKVWREKHRMEAFIRFQELGDGLYYAAIEPDYNVLPLLARHFSSRYADQDWLIYDLKRKQGLHYSKASATLSEVQLEWSEGNSGQPGKEALAEQEELYQVLWKDYFKSTGIPARKNPKLHLRHMPLRYWKYLTEKKF